MGVKIMMTINEMRVRRGEIWEQAKNFLDTHRNDSGILSAEDTATYERLEQDIVDLGHEIERQERLESFEREMKNRKFWHWIKNNAGESDTADTPTVRTLYLNGVIAEESWFDDEISPKMFRDDLNNGSGDLEVYINSVGGDCFAATQIYNMLKEYPGNVIVKIDSIAASAASVIAMAGDVVLQWQVMLF